MRLLVCGGRDYGDQEHVFSALDRVDREHCIDVLIHGKCKTGADALADKWAAVRGVPRWPFPADWKRYGKAAGPIRNQRMIDEAFPSHILPFPGQDGTADMVRRARAASIPVIEVQQ